MFERFSHSMKARSASLLLAIDTRLDRIMLGWLLVAGLASAARIATAPISTPVVSVATWAPYVMLVLAPVISTVLALRWFADGELQPQPSLGLPVIGTWRRVSSADAQLHPLYGAGGVMVSLLVGMLLNVPVRAAEFLAAIPPVPDAAPRWLDVLHLAMTFDVVLFGSLYMIAFVAALRRVPLFPRLLVAIWIADVAMQVATAQLVANAGDLPSPVASALHGLLDGNVKKVLISMALWLPYLLLSTRVNVTYRHRLPAD